MSNSLSLPPTQIQKAETNRIFALILLASGMFMALLDTQIVASSVREIQAGLAATPDEIALIQTSYLIAEVIMIPLSGWLSQMLSTRGLFVISSLGFTIASLLCASAWNIDSMMGFRTLQGFLGGAMIPLAFAAGFALFPDPKDQPKVAAVLGLTATSAPTLGPAFGGWITDCSSWRTLFLINVIPGIAITILAFFYIKIDKPNFQIAKKFDFSSAILLAAFLGCLQYALDEGPRHDWLEDETIRNLFMISAISGALFISRSLTYSSPIVDLRALTNTNFVAGCIGNFIIGIGMYCSIYLVPVFLSNIRNFDAFQIGTTVFVSGIFQIIGTFSAVMLQKRFGIRTTLLLGYLICASGFSLFAQIDATWGYAELFLPQAVRGFGTMLCVIPITSLALSGLQGDRLKGASGLFNLMRNLGGAIGLAIVNTELFYNRLQFHYKNLAQQLTNTRSELIETAHEKFIRLLDANLIDENAVAKASLALIRKLIANEALTLSFIDVYWLLSGVYIIGSLIIIFISDSPPTKSSTASGH